MKHTKGLIFCRSIPLSKRLWLAFIADKDDANANIIGSGSTQMQAVLSLLAQIAR